METLNKMKRLIGNTPVQTGGILPRSYIFKRGFALVALLCMLSVFSSSVLAKDIFVKVGGTGDGSTWETATTLLDAVNTTSVIGDVIHVAAGTYGVTEGLTVKAQVQLLGGYPTGLTGTTQTERDATTHVTTISRSNSTGSVVVMTAGTVDKNTIVDGFEITGGTFADISHGIGVQIGDYSELKNSKIYGNAITASFNNQDGARARGGAGVSLLMPNAKMTNCVVTGNTAASDCSGVLLENGFIKNCTITKNTATRRGGGLFVVNGTIEGCTISENTASQSGGGVFLENGIIQNCTISENTATWEGGGVYMAGAGHINNSKIYANKAAGQRGGGGVFMAGAGHINNSKIYANEANQTHTMASGGGIAIHVTGVTIDGCDVRGNKSLYSHAGGISILTGLGTTENRIKIINTIVANNEALASTRQAAGILTFASWVDIINCTIVNNKGASNEGNGVFSSGVQTRIQNTIIWGNTGGTNTSQVNNGTLINCAIQGVPRTAGTGLIALATGNAEAKGPLFINPTTTPGSVAGVENASWDIATNSPCIGFGLSDGNTPVNDILGTERSRLDRPLGPTIGAYEKLVGITTITSLAEFKEMDGISGAYKLGNNITLNSDYTPIDFSGLLDGNGNKIILSHEITSGGIFKSVSIGSVFENLTVELNANISNLTGDAGAFVGSLAAPSTFKNVNVVLTKGISIKSTSGNAGGFMGTLSGSLKLTECSVTLDPSAEISALNGAKTDNHVGGLIGRFEATNGSLTINESYVMIKKGALVSSLSNAHRRTGGFLGWIEHDRVVEIRNSLLFNAGELGSLDGPLPSAGNVSLSGFVTNPFNSTKISNSIVYNALGGKFSGDSVTSSSTYGIFATNAAISAANFTGCTFVTDNYDQDKDNLPAKAFPTGSTTMATVDLANAFEIAENQKINIFKTENRDAANYQVNVSLFGLKENEWAAFDQIFLKGIKTPAKEEGLGLQLLLGTKSFEIPLKITPRKGENEDVVMYVVAGATDANNDGKSWQTPWGRTRIQEALNTLGRKGGGVLNVASTPTGAPAYTTPEQANVSVTPQFFTVPVGVTLVGGWNPASGVRDGISKFTNTNSTKNRVFVLETGAEIQNLEIFGGEIAAAGSLGAGVWAKEFSKIKNCKIFDNTLKSGGSSANGAGVMMEFCSVIENSEVTNNTIFVRNGNTAGLGAGIYINGSGVVVDACEISGNKIEKAQSNNYGASGAGLYIAGSEVHVKNSKILSNVTKLIQDSRDYVKEGNGAGLYLEGSNNIIENCEIANNKAGGEGSAPPGASLGEIPEGKQNGGGLFVQGRNNIIRNNKIYGNFAHSAGGGIFILGANTLIYNNVIAYNHAAGGNAVGGDGGGIYCHVNSGNARIFNTTVVRNSSFYGTSVYGAGTSNTTFDNSIAAMGYVGKIGSTGLTGKNLVRVKGSNIIYFNDATVTSALDMKPATSDAISPSAKDNVYDDGITHDANWFKFKNNVDLLPAADYTDNLTRLLDADFSVMSGSPCVDKGKVIADIPATDILGMSRPQGAAWDIGAYEMEPAIIVKSIDYAKTSTGEDVIITATLEEANPIDQEVGLNLSYTSGSDYLLSIPTHIPFKKGSQSSSIRLRFKMIDKPVTLGLNFSANSRYITIPSSVSSTGTIALTIPVFDQGEYPVTLRLAPETVTEGGTFKASISLKDIQRKPPMRMGIELKPQTDVDAFAFSTVEDSRILWINYGEDQSNEIIVKVEKRLGQQYTQSGRAINIGKDINADHSLNRMTCELRSIKVFDTVEDDTIKVSGKMLPVSGNFFTNEKVEIALKLDSKLLSTDPMLFNLTFSPEINNAQGAQIKIAPQSDFGSYVLTIPSVFARQEVKVTATPVSSQESWLSKLDPASITFKAGNSIYYVDAEATSSGDGSTWANAFRTIEDAYAKTSKENGDEIRIAGGTYTPSSTLTIDGLTRFSGSWDPETNLRASQNPEYVWAFENQTIINGQPGARMFHIADSGLVDGIKISGGMGITLAGQGVLRNSEISNITLSPTSVVDVDNILAPIQVVDPTTTNTLIEDCYIHNNQITSTSLTSAGAIATKVTGLTVSRCIIGNNRASKGAGALSGALTLINALVAHNQSENAGAFEGTNAIIKQSTFVKNQGIIIIAGAVGTMQSSIIWGNLSTQGTPVEFSSVVTYTGIDYSLTATELTRNNIRLSSNNSTADANQVAPAFTKPSELNAGYNTSINAVTALGNWHLTTALANMGSPDVKGDDLIDLSHAKRVQKDVIDLGCYESNAVGQLEVTFTLSDYEYTGKDFSRDGKVSPVIYKVAFPMEGRIVPLKFKKAADAALSDSAIDAGTYHVTANDPNWQIVQKYEGNKETFTITQRPVSVSVDNKEVIVKSPLPTFTYTLISGTEEPRDAGKMLKISVPANATDRVGMYDITGLFVDSSNYKLVGPITQGKLTVKKQRITEDNIEWIYPDGSDMIYYNGQPRRCTVSFKGLTLSPRLDQYKVVDNAPKFPGKYSAFISLSPGADEIFELESRAMIEYQIRKVDIQIIGTIIYKTYGDEDPVYTCSTSPALFGSDRLVTAGTVRAQGEDVGSYAIPTDTWSHIGYNVTKRETCQLTINQAPLTVTPNPITHSVNLPLDSSMFSTTIIGFKRNDALADVYENMPKCWPVTLDSDLYSTVEVQVDPLTLQPDRLPKANNYVATGAKGTIYYTEESNQKLTFSTIQPLTYGSTVTMVTTSNKGNNLSFTYESSNPSILTVADGNRLETKGVGSATITVKQSGVSASGIDAAQISQLVTVSPKVITSTIPVVSYEYDGTNKNYDTKLVTFTGVLSTDTLKYTVSQNEASAPGEHNVTVTITTGEPYTFADGQSTFTANCIVIKKAVVVFTTTAPREDAVYNADTYYFKGAIDTTVPTIGTILIPLVDSVYSARDVGDHPVSISVRPSNAYYTGSMVFGEMIRITPASLNVDFKDTEYEKAIHASLPKLQKDDFVYTGLLGTDTVMVAPAYKTSATTQSALGKYPMTLDTGVFDLNVKKANYLYTPPTKTVKLSVVDKVLTMEDCEITAIAHTFDGTVKKIVVTPKVAGTFLSSDLTLEYHRNGNVVAAAIEPAIYEVTIKIGTRTLGTQTMTINKATLVLTYDQTHFTYDATPKALVFTVKPKLGESDIYFAKNIDAFTYLTTYNGSTIAPSAVGIYRVQTSIVLNAYYELTASTSMTIARLPAQVVGFNAIGASITEPNVGSQLVHAITVKSADGKAVRSGLLVDVNVAGAMSTQNYSITPKQLDFKGDSVVTFNVTILNKDEQIAYNDQELIFTLAPATAELRVDGLLQYTLKIKNIDIPPMLPLAQFYHAPSASLREGESISTLITSSSARGHATIKIKPSSKELRFKIRHGSSVYDQTHKEISVSLNSEGNAQLVVEIERSYTATDKSSKINLILSKVTRADGSKNAINGAYDTFGVEITPTNPLLAPVALSAQYESIKMVSFDLMPFVRETYTDSPVFGIQLSPIQFVESITTEKGGIISVVDQRLFYAYGALTITTPEIGFEDFFTAYLSDGFGGMTRFDATIAVSKLYSYGSTYFITPDDFENPYGLDQFSKTPSLSGSYINPFATVKAGKTVKPSKASMKVRMTKIAGSKTADSARVEVVSKIKLVNASNLKKIRAGKLLKSSKPNVYFQPAHFLDLGTQYPQVVVSSFGVSLTGKGDCAKDNKKGDALGALVISHPLVTDSLKAVGIGLIEKELVIVVKGDFFGSAPVGYLEYRKPNGTITTTKLKMINSTKTKSYQARLDNEIYTAPTKDQMKQNATENSTLMFYIPKKISGIPGERVDLLIDSSSGMSGVKSFITY